MRGACEARLAWARCGQTKRVIPAARAPRLGPACRCMAGAPASIAALADAFVMLLNTTRVHVSSRSGHVNIGCVITHMSLSSRVFTSGLIPLRTHVTETRHAGAANWEQRHVHRPMRAHARRMRRAADASPLPANGKARPGHPDAAHGPACRRMGSTCILLSKSALLGPCAGPCAAHAARG